MCTWKYFNIPSISNCKRAKRDCWRMAMAILNTHSIPSTKNISIILLARSSDSVVVNKTRNQFVAYILNVFRIGLERESGSKVTWYQSPYC